MGFQYSRNARAKGWWVHHVEDWEDVVDMRCNKDGLTDGIELGHRFDATAMGIRP